MIVAEDKKIKKCPVSFQPDIENLLQDLSPDDFASASRQEKDDFIQDRQSVSYWKDAWRRLKKNVVAMVALGVIVFLFLFAFVGPLLIPYGYDEFNKGAENLYPYHYTLEDTQRVNDEIASRTQSDVVDVDEMIAQAKAEAEKKGEKFTKKDEAVIRAKAKVAAKPSEDSSEEQSVDEDSVRKELGIKKHIFGYSQAELERKANGEKVFPHVFGTDMYGRDILVRVMYGARVSMSVGVFAAILVLVIGALYGAISGYCGGKVDAVMQRIVELIYAVPEMLVVLLIATALKPILTDYVNSSGTSPLKSFVNVLGPNLISMFIAFGLLYWVTMSRIIRGQVLQLKQQEYVTAARALGASGGRIIRRHLLPNCIGQIVVTTCLQIPSAIFLESFLSYLGVGVSAPLPSLGSMATDALSGMYTYTYRLIVPSVILSIMILAFNLFGDGLRDALDPKLKK
jgi:oligopeptide transport system permease protein